MDRIGFIASTEKGTVARKILDMGKCEIATWHPDNDLTDNANKHIACVEIEELADVPLIIVSADIARCRKLARKLGDVITGRHVVVHTIRGIEATTMKTASQILHEETPTRRIGFVTGPMRLEDLKTGRPASAVCASYFPEVHDLVEEAMISPTFRVYRSRDLIGAELSATYARLIALMSGLADALKLGSSLQATLFARGLAEMARFVVSRDGHEQTAFGLAGAGNLYVDTLHEGSDDFQMGHHFAESTKHNTDSLLETYGSAANEVLDVLAAFETAAEESSLELHLLKAAASLVTDGIGADTVIRQLMSLPVLYE